jgi:hypothetical protein
MTELSTSQSSQPAALDLHLAEYQALMTRNTYWLTLEYALGPILVLTLGLIVQVEKRLGLPVAIWAATLAVQATIFTFLITVAEQYRNIRYIEHDLRRLVDPQHRSAFWLYESYLRRDRRTHRRFWENDYITLLWPLLALGVAIYFTWPLRGWNWLGVVLNGIGLFVNALFVYAAVELRGSLALDERDEAEPSDEPPRRRLGNNGDV